MVVTLELAALAASGSKNEQIQTLYTILIYKQVENKNASFTPTITAVHVRTADLIHQQHEDEAQHQRDANISVELLVTMTVPVFSTFSHNSFYNLLFRNFCFQLPVAMVVPT